MAVVSTVEVLDYCINRQCEFYGDVYPHRNGFFSVGDVLEARAE